MRAVIVGLGSIGKRHLRNLRALLPSADITVWRQHGRSAEDAKKHPEATRFVYSLEDAIKFQPDLAIIANPAAYHIKTGMDLARAGASLLIEKPISDRLENVRELIELCANRSLALMVGYNLRFHPALQHLYQLLRDNAIGRVLCLQAEVGQYLPDWRPDSNYSQGVSAQSQLGGGVVLELSHEIDYARWLMGEADSVSAQTKKLSDLQLDVEDTANIHLSFASGALGNIHLNMIQRNASRTCTLIGTEGTLLWDGLSCEVKLFSSKTGRWEQIYSSCSFDRNEMFVNELKYLLDCLASAQRPIPTGEDGLQVLKIAVAACESSRLQRTIAI